MTENELKVTVRKKITGSSGLFKVEHLFRKFTDNEIIPYAKNTGYVELTQNVIPDKNGAWVNPVLYFECLHQSTIGVTPLCRKAKDYFDQMQDAPRVEVLSIAAGMEGSFINLTGLLRVYNGDVNNVDIYGLYEYLGEVHRKGKEKTDKLLIPEGAVRKISPEERAEHDELVRKQMQILDNAKDGIPFLNAITNYVPIELHEIDDRQELVYDLETRDMQISTILPYKEFIAIFQQCMRYITGVERDFYYDVMRSKEEFNQKKAEFFNVIEGYIRKTFLDTRRMTEEDLPALKAKLDRALFQLYIVQDLIDDPEITDIKITAPDSVRVRVEGRAYLSNITFIDRDDYERFIQGIAVKNNVDLNVPVQTFTDEHDSNYILRFSITAPYVTGTGLPIIHIRKVARKKLLAPDLIQAGMFDEKIRDYLIDCGKYSRGVVFAGPPGSGKTVLLNWFLEDAYESSAEILVIQENDELFCYRRGVMFEHVVNNPMKGERACSLEDLGQLALVAGANVFIIGEAKGAEICSAITLSNSGCRTAITIHSPSSTETIDKMADLAMRGYATSYDQAKRMIKSFQTIVYLQDFKVQEISEIVGYDETKKDMIYRKIYRRESEAG